MKKIKINYCKAHNIVCDNKLFETEVGKVEYIFCCRKGLFESVNKFLKILK